MVWYCIDYFPCIAVVSRSNHHQSARVFVNTPYAWRWWRRCWCCWCCWLALELSSRLSLVTISYDSIFTWRNLLHSCNRSHSGCRDDPYELMPAKDILALDGQKVSIVSANNPQFGTFNLKATPLVASYTYDLIICHQHTHTHSTLSIRFADCISVSQSKRCLSFATSLMSLRGLMTEFMLIIQSKLFGQLTAFIVIFVLSL